MSQTVFNPASLNDAWKAIRDEQSFPAHIRAIDTMKASDIFGFDCKNPERDVIHLKVELESGETFYETYTLPKSLGSWKQDNFKLGHFVKKYGEAPFVGMTVQVTYKEKFARILV